MGLVRDADKMEIRYRGAESEDETSQRVSGSRRAESLNDRRIKT